MVRWKLAYTRQARKDARKLAASGLRLQAEELLEILQKDPWCIYNELGEKRQSITLKNA